MGIIVAPVYCGALHNDEFIKIKLRARMWNNCNIIAFLS